VQEDDRRVAALVDLIVADRNTGRGSYPGHVIILAAAAAAR
jgi:hypothetical protein